MWNASLRHARPDSDCWIRCSRLRKKSVRVSFAFRSSSVVDANDTEKENGAHGSEPFVTFLEMIAKNIVDNPGFCFGGGM